MRNIAIALGSICIVLAAGGCQTVEFDDPALLGSAEAEPGIETLKEEEQANIEALEDYAVEEELKTVDIEKSVVYVEKPVYYPEEADAGEPVVLTGQEAAAESLRQALKSPQKFNGGLTITLSMKFTASRTARPTSCLSRGKWCLKCRFYPNGTSGK